MNRNVRALAIAALERPTKDADLDYLADLARTVLGPARIRKAVAMSRSDKSDKRSEREERIGAIRLEVIRRTAGRCSVPGCTKIGEELHHVRSGPSRRRDESVETCLWLCWTHHRGAHRGDLDTLEGMLSECLSRGMASAADAIVHRIEKIKESRSASQGLK